MAMSQIATRFRSFFWRRQAGHDTFHIMRAALILALLTGATPAFADSFGDRDYLAAVDAFDVGDDTKALTLFESAIAKNLSQRERDEAHFLAARTALRLGDSTKALSHLTAVQRSMPEVADFVLAETALAYRVARRWKDALATWEKVLQRWPDSPVADDARYGIADAHYATNQLAKAQEAYTAATEAHPNHERVPAVQFNQARILELTGHYSEAADAYATMAYNDAGGPFSGPANERLGAMVAKRRAPAPTFQHLVSRLDRLLGSRSLEDAATALTTVTALAKTKAQQEIVDFRAARLAMKSRDYKAAVVRFASLASRATGIAQLEYKSWIARCYMAADDAEAAVRAYQELAELYQSRTEGREALYKAGWLAFNAGQYPAAVQLFGRYVERYGRDRQADEAAWYLAWATYRSGNLPATLSALAALRTKFPSSTLVPRTYYWEGRVLTSLGRAAEARSSYETTLAAAPLDYYGVLARQRLGELVSDTRPIVDANDEPLLFASLDIGGFDATPSETAADGRLVAAAPTSAMADRPLAPPGTLDSRPDEIIPWGNAAFDWQGPTARRMLRLIALHNYDAAADLVMSLPAKAGQEKAAVAYARARLLYALGDYNAGYRVSAIVFRKELAEAPTPTNRALMRIAYPDAHANLVESAAREFSVSPLLVLAIMRQESAFDDRARSAASANGLMQIIPDTATKIAKALREDGFEGPQVTEKSVNVRFGTWYLGQLMTKFNDNPIMAIASYNAGPIAVAKWVDQKHTLAVDEFVEEIPFRETRGYVRRVISNLAVYSALYGRTLRLPERVIKEYGNNVDF
ncbi:MAG: transglycosylase SLT domain-containing protein [Myxococcota bacterium]